MFKSPIRKICYNNLKYKNAGSTFMDHSDKQKVRYIVYFLVILFAILQISTPYIIFSMLSYIIFTPYVYLSLITSLIFSAYSIRYYIYAFASTLKKRTAADDCVSQQDERFISIMLPVYNEAKVIDRLLLACTSLEYPNYEVIVTDDSTDPICLGKLEEWKKHSRVKVIHRNTRDGWKGEL